MGETGKRRGAQVGNLNALKHGFYSDRFKKGEIDDLEAVAQAQNGVQDEIILMRVLIRRVFEQATCQAEESSDDPKNDLETWSNALNALGAASTRLAGLLRVQQVLTSGSSNEILNALSTALKEVSSEIGC